MRGVIFMNKKTLKILGLATTLVSCGIAFITNYVTEKELEILVDEKVNEALKDKDNEES